MQVDRASTRAVVAPLFTGAPIPGIADPLLQWPVHMKHTAHRGNYSWSSGGYSDTVGGISVTSFGVLDQIVEILQNTALFPELKQITLVGYSLGGEVVQHYAVLSQSVPREGVSVRYVSFDAGSYLYFDNTRAVSALKESHHGGAMGCDWNPKLSDPLAACENIGFEPSDCRGYDDYPRGLSNLSDKGYVSQVDVGKAIHEVYPKREMVYIVGQLDTCFCSATTNRFYKHNITGSSTNKTYCSYTPWPNLAARGPGVCLDTHLCKACSCVVQGINRMQRALNYAEFLNRFYTYTLPHRFAILPSVGHFAKWAFSTSLADECMFGDIRLCGRPLNVMAAEHRPEPLVKLGLGVLVIIFVGVVLLLRLKKRQQVLGRTISQDVGEYTFFVCE